MYSVVGMFPYPSGAPHLGHVRVYTITDVRARHARRHGLEVMHPMGWDAFGLPAENAAIARGVDPAEWTRANIAQMRATFRAMGWSFDPDREIDTSSPAYYRWTQWLFLRLHAAGLAFEADGWVNWCPSCATVLADEQVVGGCWRCGSAVERRRRSQWYFRITRYAQRLWDGLDRLSGWNPAAVAVQRNWIGRSEGAVVRFGPIEVFTTRADTVYGVTAVVVAPEHPLADQEGVQDYVRAALGRSAVDRRSDRPRDGVPLGMTVPHPLTGEALPVWVADYVVGDYGTGAVMCVPAHDERDRAFADAVGLPVRTVIADGVLVDSAEHSGLRCEEAASRIADDLRARDAGGPEVRFRLRDWSIGRQRRWGCPIPMVRCPRCGVVPVPEAELPVTVDAPAERGCPTCGGVARRETDTLDSFVCSSWYVFRYCDPHNDAAPFSRAEVDRRMPLPTYVGGIEHAAQHMLYFRFVTQALHDQGLVGFDEPVDGFVVNGMVLGADARKMSKSRGNGVEPTEMLAVHAADALRMAILADVPIERDLPWEAERVEVAARFLARLDRIFAEVPAGTAGSAQDWPDGDRLRTIGATFAALDRDIRANALHNALARLHTLASELRAVLAESARAPAAAAAIARDVLVALEPFVPDWVTARWPASFGAMSAARWPEYAGEAAPSVRWMIQVDGRTVGGVDLPADATEADVCDRIVADPRARSRVGNRAILRRVVVPGRLVNLVTAG